MNCPVCGQPTRVMESRPKEGGVYRRRKCAAGHLSYTVEAFVAPPTPKLKRPSVEKPPKRKKPLKKPKKSPPTPYAPALKEWNLVVTKNSPLWLKSIAMQLEAR